MTNARCPTCSKPFRPGSRFCTRCGAAAPQLQFLRDNSGWTELENRRAAKIAKAIIMVILAVAVGVGFAFQDPRLAIMIAVLILFPAGFARQCNQCANVLRLRRSRMES